MQQASENGVAADGAAGTESGMSAGGAAQMRISL